MPALSEPNDNLFVFDTPAEPESAAGNALRGVPSAEADETDAMFAAWGREPSTPAMAHAASVRETPSATCSPGDSAPAPRRSLAHRLAWLCGGLLLAASLWLQSGQPATSASALTAAQPTRQTKRMDQIKVGDVVVARDEHTGQIAPRRVLRVSRRKSNHLRHLTFQADDGSTQNIKTTDEHPFYSLDQRQFVLAGKLRESELVTGPGGRSQTLIETRREEFPLGTEVFNFEVEGFHTYFVSADGRSPAIWVHNADLCFTPILEKLSREDSDAFREAARDIWQLRTGRRAIWDDQFVHHRIPLEWAHRFPNADPNRIANLVGLDGPTHTLITNAWADFKRMLNGAQPTQAQIMQQALDLDDQFGHLFNFLPPPRPTP